VTALKLELFKTWEACLLSMTAVL